MTLTMLPQKSVNLNRCRLLQVLPLAGLHLDPDQSAFLTTRLATNAVNFTAPFSPYRFLSEFHRPLAGFQGSADL